MSENKNAKTPADEGQPVAWMHNFIEHNVITHIPADIGRHPERWTPLYTAPCQTCQSLAMAVMNDQTYHEKVIAKRKWVGLTDEEIDALSQARSLTDELMDCVDRLGSEADTVDPRVWQHLLVYAPKPEEEPVAWITNGGKGELWWYRSSKFDEEGNLIGPNQDDIPLYTAPPKKEWVGMTDDEIQDLGYLSEKFDASNSEWFDRWGFARAIEQSLREKNHG